LRRRRPTRVDARSTRIVVASHVNRHRSLWRRAAIILVLCAVIASVLISDGLHGAMMHLLEQVSAVIDEHPRLGALLFVGLAAVSAMVAFVSTAVLVPAALYAWGGPATLSMLWLGWTLGGAATYGIGRYFGRPIARRLTDDRMLRRFERRVVQGAPFWLVLLVQLALPSEIPGYLLGLARYPFTRYLGALAIAELPFAVAAVRLGTNLLDHRSAGILAIGVAIAALSLGSLFAARRVLRPTRPSRQS
jgi:uncharacterized membrane protein YdjX (TVP38/TMEM64 family)